MLNRRTTLTVVWLAFTTTLAPLLVPGAAQAAPSTPAFGPAIDRYAAYDPQDTCQPAPKPAVVDFRDLLLHLRTHRKPHHPHHRGLNGQ